jgi:type II secretory pathway pseudopilin PulG
MKRKNSQYYQKGVSIIEILLAISIFALLITVFVGAFLFGQDSSLLSGKINRGLFLAEQGLEAVRNIRDESFSNLIDGIHGLNISDNQWVFSGSQDTTDIFNRYIDISSIDSETKQVIANVSWQQNSQRPANISLLTHFTNWNSEREIKDWIAPEKEIELVEKELRVIDTPSLKSFCPSRRIKSKIILDDDLKICLLREILEKHFVQDYSKYTKMLFVILIVLLLILINLLRIKRYENTM